MQLHVNPSHSQPIYRQLKEQIAEAISDRQLVPGETLTPQRQLAQQLVISPLAVERAYAELERDGLCEPFDGALYRVAALPRAALDSLAFDRRLKSLVEREVLLRELELARDIQTRLLPPRRIEGEGFSVESRSRPAGVVSGDFHEVILGVDGSVGVVVADVSGTGFGASLLMASVKAMLPFIAAELSVEETLRELNRRLHADLGKRQFVAMTFARLSPNRGRLTVANAGMPDPFLLRRGEAPHEVSVPGPRLPLGMREEVEYEAATLAIASPDRLLFYSDGIPEALTAADRPLGYEALYRLLADAHAESASDEGWIDRFLDRVRGATRPVPEDDWTALVVNSQPREV
jgi:sigma-B regulation protein RsbU (phosphoserine phosphatase)